MGAARHFNGWDAFAWFLNVSTSVLIVFANKVVLDTKTGHDFGFATTLCGLHFMACAISVGVVQALGITERAPLPWADVLAFAFVASSSIACLNLSLLVNSVGFYQVTKLLIIPCVCALELCLQNKRLTAYQACSIAAVVAGVGIVTVTDVQVSGLGLIVAMASVITSGLQQVMCGALQRKHYVSSHQLLSNTAHVQGGMLLLIGPFIDQLVSRRWVLDYGWTRGAAEAMLVSCGLAVLVNISQFMCLGRFSAVSFQVLGHTKTILVLLASWLVLHEPMTPRKLLGICLAVVGMAAYGNATMRRNSNSQPSAAANSTHAAGKQAGPVARIVARVAALLPALRGGAARLKSHPILRPSLSHPIRVSADGGGGSSSSGSSRDGSADGGGDSRAGGPAALGAAQQRPQRRARAARA